MNVPGGEVLPELEIDAPSRQRRLTVLVRVILLIPQYIVLWFLSIAAFVVAVLGWFGALALGRLPYWAAEFLGGYLGYQFRISGYEYLLVDRYPPFSFTPAGYPVRIFLAPGRLNRLAVLFRIILAIPAYVLYIVLSYGWNVCAFVCWLVVLIMGRNPLPLYGATAALVRYQFRYLAYWLMLSSAYPKGLFGETPAGPPPAGPTSTRPLVLTSGGRAVLIIFIVVGVLAAAGAITGDTQRSYAATTTAVTAPR